MRSKILRELNHRNIVAFHELGEAGGLLYFVMDCVRGCNAAQFLKERGPLPLSLAVRPLSRGFRRRSMPTSESCFTATSSRPTS